MKKPKEIYTIDGRFGVSNHYGEVKVLDTHDDNREIKLYSIEVPGLILNLMVAADISIEDLAFNKVVAPEDRLSEEEIDFFVKKEDVPATLKSDISDPSYGKKKVLFRRTSGNATVTIFDGGHELVAKAAIDWTQQIHKKKEKLNKPDAGDGK